MTGPLPTHGVHSLSASVQHMPAFRVPAPLRFIIGVLHSIFFTACAVYAGMPARCHWCLCEERFREPVVVDVGRQGRHAVLRPLPAPARRRRGLGQSRVLQDVGASLALSGCRGVVQQGLGSSSGKAFAQCAVTSPLARAVRSPRWRAGR